MSKKIHSQRRARISLSVGLTLIAIGWSTISSAQYEKYEVAPMDPIPASPRCGVAGLSHEEKIQRNVALARIWMQSYTGKGDHPTWAKFGCSGVPQTGGNNVFMRFVTERPKSRSTGGAPPPSEYSELSAKYNDNIEATVWRDAIPNFGFIPGSFRILNVDENSITWVQWFGDTTSALGDFKIGDKHFDPGSEVDFIRLNDDGKIVHFEFWDDRRQLDAEFQQIFGRTYGYGEMPVYLKDLVNKYKSIKEKQGAR